MAEIDIQVMDPAEVTLPLNVQQLAFMNRSLYPQLVHGDTSQWTREEFYILDTIMRNRIFMGVRQSMSESPLYELDSIIVIQARRTDTVDILIPLSSEDLRELKTTHPADALISLELYHIDDSISAEAYYDDQGKYHEAYLGFNSLTVWRIYDLNLDTVFDEYVLKDTASWYAYDRTVNASMRKLPGAVNALREAAFNIGRKYGYRISPTWIEEPRFYFGSGKKEMRAAGKKAGAGDWKGAAEIWKLLAYQEDEKTAARASFNMALVCEMEDLLLPALDWAIKSYSIRQKDLTKEYIEILQERYQDRKKLRRQIPINNEPELP